MKRKLILWMLVLGSCIGQLTANNVRIPDKVKVSGRLGIDTLVLSFPLKWENSWRLDNNWDAVYLFIKYKRLEVEEPWRHLCIKSDGHRVDPGYTWAVADTEDSEIGGKTGNSNVGLFVFRNTAGAGPASTMVRVAVDISQGDLTPYYRATYDDFRSGKMDISVTAIEMVYIPRGSYYLGDNTCYNTLGGAGGDPLLVDGNVLPPLTVKNGMAQSIKPGTVTLNERFPVGYDGFYCMKYEISQAQYVDFLNKLPYSEQKNRIENNLDELNPGDYVFGDKKSATARNGIILEKRRTKGLETTGNRGDTAVVFGHNLSWDDDYNGAFDGQTIACNYLTPNDAWAYADWAGLRLMTELEFEKACRVTNPTESPVDRQFAWNGQSLRPPTGGIPSDVRNTVKEITAGDANTNAQAKINGPVRCGSFAREGTTLMSVTGATYWGILDMTGNLGEMVCNATYGWHDMTSVEGDGSLTSKVISWRRDTSVQTWGYVHVPAYHNKVTVTRTFATEFKDRYGKTIEVWDTFELPMPVYPRDTSRYISVWRTVKKPVLAWPENLRAYGLRGGSYKDTEVDNLSVSGRKEAELYAEDVPLNPHLAKARRHPYATFRLMKHAPVQKIKAGRIVLPNDEYKDLAILCTEKPYVIKGVEAANDGSVAMVYEWEENDGKGWKKIAGEAADSLALTVHWNTTDTLVSRDYRRKTITPLGEGYSNTVTLTLAGQMHLDGTNKEMTGCKGSVEITANFGVKVDSVIWYCPKLNKPIGNKDIEVISSTGVMQRTDFEEVTSGPRNYLLTCNAYLNGCPLTEEASLTIQPSWGKDDCPAMVQGPDGKSYRTIILDDCRCWMLDPLATETDNSEEAASSGILMYNFNDLANEPAWDNDQGIESTICPEGFYVPSETDVLGLIDGLSDGPVDAQFKGRPYGLVFGGDEYLNGTANYWAVIFENYSQNQTEYEYGCFIMIINSNGMIELVDKDYTIEDVANNPDLEGVSFGEFHFPVRCVKAKPNN